MAKTLSEQIVDARRAGDWELAAKLWEQRRLAEVDEDAREVRKAGMLGDHDPDPVCGCWECSAFRGEV